MRWSLTSTCMGSVVRNRSPCGDRLPACDTTSWDATIRPLVVHRQHATDAARALDDRFDDLDGVVRCAYDQVRRVLQRLFDGVALRPGVEAETRRAAVADVGATCEADAQVLDRPLPGVGQVEREHDAPVAAVDRLPVLGGRFLDPAPGALERLIVGAGHREQAQPVPPGRTRPRRRGRGGDRHLEVRVAVGRELPARLPQREPVGTRRDGLATEQAHDHVDRLVHHVPLLSWIDAEHIGVRGEDLRPDAEHSAALREVVTSS